ASHPISMSDPYNELHELIDPDSAGCFATYSAAETAIRRLLSVLKFETMLLGDGDRVETMLLQPAGSARKNGDHVNTYLAWVRGEAHVLRTSPKRDPYTLINTFRPIGLRVESCGTCEHFRFSGTSYDMSGGSMGHCTKRLTLLGKSDLQ